MSPPTARVPSCPPSSRYALSELWRFWAPCSLLLCPRRCIPNLGYLLATGTRVGVYLLVVYKSPSILTFFVKMPYTVVFCSISLFLSIGSLWLLWHWWATLGTAVCWQVVNVAVTILSFFMYLIISYYDMWLRKGHPKGLWDYCGVWSVLFTTTLAATIYNDGQLRVYIQLF